jgi:glycosyltransferase involved in cell wall biosynthesis
MFPINLITTVPIININIFGSFTVQENIKKIIGLSHEVIDRSCLVAKRNKHEVMYIPSERPPQIPELAQKVRSKFNISATDFVFGRIGRPVDDIFDPIALNAFAFLQKTYPEVAKYCHYIIMAPSLRMKEKVIGENIKNVHFLDPSPNEHDVFAFHQSINCLAHARLDGETCGLNITESMLCGNPILTHTSHIWNAHLEYLLPTFSRVAKKDDYQSYAQHMKEFYSIFKSDINKWKEMRQASKKQAEKLFLIESNIDRFEKYIKESCH